MNAMISNILRYIVLVLIRILKAMIDSLRPATSYIFFTASLTQNLCEVTSLRTVNFLLFFLWRLVLCNLTRKNLQCCSLLKSSLQFCFFYVRYLVVLGLLLDTEENIHLRELRNYCHLGKN